MNEKKRYQTLEEYMLEEFGVTPENIDEKLQEVKEKAKAKVRQLER